MFEFFRVRSVFPRHLSLLSHPEMKSIAEAIGIFAHDQLLWSNTASVRNLLERVELSADPGEVPFRSRESLPDLALLSIKWHEGKGRPFWDWVVFIREKGRPFVLNSKRPPDKSQNGLRPDATAMVHPGD